MSSTMEESPVEATLQNVGGLKVVQIGLATGLYAASLSIALLVLAGCGGGSGGGQSGSSSNPSGANSTSSSASSLAAATAVSKGLLAAVANPAGDAATFTAAGTIDSANPFFKSFGNGRSCASCHDQKAGWSLTPEVLAARFAQSEGTDPVFLPVDGANSPLAPVRTPAERRAAYSMLLTKGLIRIGLPMPSSTDFSLTAVDDPYGFASAAELSLFRRPLPVANLKFITAIMWDGRETLSAVASGSCIKGATPAVCFGPTVQGLLNQANTAALTHEQSTNGLSNFESEQIVSFATTLFNAQTTDRMAGSLSADGAMGGPVALSQRPFYFGINDVLAGDYLTGAPFDPQVMGLYKGWLPKGAAAQDVVSLARAAIARGEAIFNTRPIVISGVPGFNDLLGQPVVTGSCSSCHSTPDVGTHSVPRFMNTGVASVLRRTPDLPLYTLTQSASGVVAETTDPGVALQTGKFADIGKFKVPGLRGLASRAPFFHNGSASDLPAVVGFYQGRFNLNLSPQEASDLVAFLRAL